jgi:hypothetical protein
MRLSTVPKGTRSPGGNSFVLSARYASEGTLTMESSRQNAIQRRQGCEPLGRVEGNLGSPRPFNYATGSVMAVMAVRMAAAVD